jgi:Na+/H+-dicarboxylate symporter
MIEKIKQSHVMGIAIAVAIGVALAHFIVEIGDYLWYSFLEDYVVRNAWMLIDLSVLATLSFLGVWQIKRLLRRETRPRKSTAPGNGG